MHPALDRVRLTLSYDAWANRQVVKALTEKGAAPAAAVRQMAHVLGARGLWLDRLQGKAPTLAVWPEWSQNELPGELERSEEAWAGYLETLTEADLARSISYTSSKGQPWFSRVEDVLTHLTVHGSHHRGQIASALRAAGKAPPAVDFIHARRIKAVL